MHDAKPRLYYSTPIAGCCVGSKQIRNIEGEGGEVYRFWHIHMIKQTQTKLKKKKSVQPSYNLNMHPPKAQYSILASLAINANHSDISPCLSFSHLVPILLSP